MLENKSENVEPKIPVWAESLALILILGIALFFRLWQLELVPAGFYYDEAIDLKLGQDVVSGARSVYFAEGWGREGLYYYLVAIVLQIVPANPLALRVTAVLCSVGVLLTAFILVRSWHGRLAAWLTVTWLSLTYWPVFASRFGVRNITLPLVWGLTVWLFWRAWNDKTEQTRRGRWLVCYFVAGLGLGLTLYTYQPARFMPFVLIFFFAYIFLFHRTQWQRRWRGIAMMGVTAVIIMLPLLFALQANSGNETGERAFTIKPLTELLAGNPRPVLENSLAVAKAFTISGDPLESYNVPDRPIFVPAWTGLFFYAGLALALWRWRRPIYAFVLIWLGVALLPTILTISAPNFNRMIAAQVPVMFLTAVPLAELVHYSYKKWTHWGASGLLLIGFAALTVTGLSTWHDYFIEWPAHPGTIAPLNRNIAAVARYLADLPPSQSVVISSPHLEDSDPYIVSVSLDREDLIMRWVDTGQAVAVPANQTDVQLIVTSERWLDAGLQAFLGIPGQPLAAAEEFAVFDLAYPQPVIAQPVLLRYLPPGSSWSGSQQLQPALGGYPYKWCSCQSGSPGWLSLEGAAFLTDQVAPGDAVTAVTAWTVLQDGVPGSLSFFVHILNENGEIVGQQDGLGYPPHTWHGGDRFLQIHRVPLDSSLPPGQYWLQFGLYWRETGQRWTAVAEDGSPWADRFLLPFTVQ